MVHYHDVRSRKEPHTCGLHLLLARRRVAVAVAPVERLTARRLVVDMGKVQHRTVLRAHVLVQV